MLGQLPLPSSVEQETLRKASLQCQGLGLCPACRSYNWSSMLDFSFFLDFRGQAGAPHLGGTPYLAAPRKAWNVCVSPCEFNLKLEALRTCVLPCAPCPGGPVPAGTRVLMPCRPWCHSRDTQDLTTGVHLPVSENRSQKRLGYT